MPTIGRGGMRLERSRAAERDLDDLLAFGIARFGEVIAGDYFFSFDNAFALILDHPQIGEAIDAIEAGTRKLTHSNHRIFYEIDGACIRIIRVLHHAMDVGENL